MDSPNQGSASSSSSSPSPPPDDIFISRIDDEPTPIATGSSKRRLMTASTSSYSLRNPKTRRREGREEFIRRPPYESRLGRDDVVDVALMEQLCTQFGDPFDDSVIKS
ncbi:hypothetical protein BKA93DRAFT_494615 [Sparassis latifolia]|uniref:Uncharacterized protein n=1 Tax=Sparassis crispa TaxID=139825 RepID=A0A401GNC3_9APHY|nr:hypothetical protein SCP_0507740 [Sparassis crispa]GBE83718.1 hypothetical protein SCP_0507740 [Sparassis crispa]